MYCWIKSTFYDFRCVWCVSHCVSPLRCICYAQSVKLPISWNGQCACLLRELGIRKCAQFTNWANVVNEIYIFVHKCRAPRKRSCWVTRQFSVIISLSSFIICLISFMACRIHPCYLLQLPMHWSQSERHLKFSWSYPSSCLYHVLPRPRE